MTDQSKNIFNTEAPLYWNSDLTVTPIAPNTKRGIEKWQHFIDQVPSAERQKDWLSKYSDHGIGLLTGKKMANGLKIIGIDVDDNQYVAPIIQIFGPVVSAKKGKKGITLFVLAEDEVKHTAINFGKKRIIDVLVRKCCVLPPTLHPDTGAPYQWHGKPIYECSVDDLRVVSQNDIKLLKAIIQDENHTVLINGEATHDPALSLTAKVAQIHDEESVIRFLAAFLPENYEGDLREELPEMVKSAKEKGLGASANLRYDPKDTGPVPMGFTDNGNYVFLHQEKNILSVFGPGNLMSIPGLCDLASYDFWLSICPMYNKDGYPTGKFDANRIGNLLMEECRKTGPFIPARVRGCGIWREGTKIFQNLRGPLPASQKYTYIRFEALPEFNTDKHIDAREVLDWLQLFNWQDPAYATLLLGWVAIAPICGAVNWRTHIFLHGPKKTGKSTLIKGITSLLEPMAISLDGTSSEAGIRQSIAADSRPVILDEFESDNNTKRMLQILKLARSASSGGAPIARGTPEGRALQFQIHSSFCFGAIVPIIGTAADRSRIVELELCKHSDDRNIKTRIENGQSYIENHCLSWPSRMLELLEPINQSIDTFKKHMLVGDLRHTENMANLLGAAFSAIKGRECTEDEALEWISHHQKLIEHLGKAHEEDDSADCLNHLLQSRGEDQDTIGQMIRGTRPVDEPMPSGTTGPSSALIKYGIKPIQDGILVANKHQALNEIFSGTIWASGGWSTALKRLPGAEIGDHRRARFSGGQAVRCVFLPIKIILSSDDDT